MEAVFKYKLDKEEIEKIEKYCNSVDYCAVEQFIGWNEIFYKSKVCYFYLAEEGVIKSFCQITEKLGSAQISLGPVCCDKEIMVTSLNEIISYYKTRYFYYIGIQLYYKAGFDSEYIEYQLNKKYNIKYIFNSENTKSSIEINLQESVEDIYARFSSEHKRCIRKARKLGVTVDEIKDDQELGALFEILAKMYKKREMPDDSFSTGNKEQIFNYLTDKKNGKFLAVKDKDGIMVGGIVLIYQGNTVRMYKGASDPDRREIPINHILVHEIIKMAKDAGFKYLDLWGYNHFVSKTDQVYNINRFKSEFGGYYTFLAKKMNVQLIPNGYYIFKLLMRLKKISSLKTK